MMGRYIYPPVDWDDYQKRVHQFLKNVPPEVVCVAITGEQRTDIWAWHATGPKTKNPEGTVSVWCRDNDGGWFDIT